MSAGVLPLQQIEALIAGGAITSASPVESGQLQPASLDLRLGARAWRLRASFLPGSGPAIAARLDDSDLVLHAIDLRPGAVLETGGVYLAELQEGFALPAGVTALANPKSSTGRLDVFTRIIAEGAGAFDRAPDGYRGPLYAEISPRTFAIKTRTGDALAQARFRQGEPSAAREILLSVDLSGGGVVGYRARRHGPLVDLSAVGAHAAEKYWEPITAPDGKLILDPGEFYILASKESVSVPPHEAAEMAPSVLEIGEFRVHYAGFFDPGFGHGHNAKAVLEVRGRDVPFLLEDGQPVARLIYEPLTEPPSKLYGEGGSHYQAQGLKLGKHFAPWGG